LFKRFKKQFSEIKSEVLGLNESQNNVFDSILAPVFFVLLNRFFDLNIAIIGTGFLVVLTIIYRVLRKDDLKFAFIGVVGTIVALLIARFQGSASGFFLPGIIRDLSIALIGFISILIRRPFTIYSSQYFRKWPMEWYLLPSVKPAYNQVAILWVAFLSLKGGLQILFFNNPEILAIIKLSTSNQTTLILLIVSYFLGLRKLKNVSPPWKGQERGF
jgi:hypothetical protein